MKPTSPDPVVEEIRAVRHELAERFGDDIDALCDFLVQEEQQHAERLVTRTPKEPQRAHVVGSGRS